MRMATKKVSFYQKVWIEHYHFRRARKKIEKGWEQINDTFWQHLTKKSAHCGKGISSQFYQPTQTFKENFAKKIEGRGIGKQLLVKLLICECDTLWLTRFTNSLEKLLVNPQYSVIFTATVVVLVGWNYPKSENARFSIFGFPCN